MRFHYKIKINCIVYLAFACSTQLPLFAQQPEIVKKYKTYQRQVKEDSLQKMTELKILIPSIIYDLRYATKDNFTKKQLYPSGRYTYMHLAPALAIRNIQSELAPLGLGLLVFDAYRPWSVTKMMWDLIHDDRYVADPSKGSGHNRGLAIDLTLIRLSSGQLLDMGTGFDNFTDSAHHGFTGLQKQVLENRKILKEVMEKYGFRALDTEWWHYSWPNDRNYSLLDIDQKKLR
jgi:D-alanyl-D-alanine dipeptidase